jgi:hypothetical protein
MGLGRVALRCARGWVSVLQSGDVSVRPAAAAGPSETFQWIETFTGELTLLSLSTHRYLRVDGTGVLRADSPGPHPNRRDGVRWDWRLATTQEPRV